MIFNVCELGEVGGVVEVGVILRVTGLVSQRG